MPRPPSERAPLAELFASMHPVYRRDASLSSLPSNLGLPAHTPASEQFPADWQARDQDGSSCEWGVGETVAQTGLRRCSFS
jgi:hypothetical protein